MSAVHAPRRILASPFAWLVLLFGIAEFTASGLLPWSELPSASEANRTPLGLRGWPEYVSGDRLDTPPLVVVVGNSQGLGYEIRDAALTWTGRVRNGLADRTPPARLENWSMAGITTGEIELLSLQAIRRKARVVVFPLAYGNFNNEDETRLGSGPSDIDLLAGGWLTWAELHRTDVGRQATWDELLRRGLLLHSSLMRARIALLDWIGNRTPKDAQTLLFGHERPRTDAVEAAVDGSWPATEQEWRKKWEANPSTARTLHNIATLNDQRIDRRLDNVRRSVPQWQRLLDEHGVKAIWVWVPTSMALWSDASRAHVRRFYDEAGAIVEAAGGTALNLLEAIPDEEFITMTHMGAEGSARMAGQVLPAIADALP